MQILPTKKDEAGGGREGVGERERERGTGGKKSFIYKLNLTDLRCCENKIWMLLQLTPGKAPRKRIMIINKGRRISEWRINVGYARK